MPRTKRQTAIKCPRSVGSSTSSSSNAANPQPESPNDQSDSERDVSTSIGSQRKHRVNYKKSLTKVIKKVLTNNGNGKVEDAIDEVLVLYRIRGLP
jgi:hypothetical protein